MKRIMQCSAVQNNWTFVIRRSYHRIRAQEPLFRGRRLLHRFSLEPIAMLFYRMGTFAPAHGRRYFSLLTMRPLCASTQTVLVLFV
jgi:hypothetical protein